MKPTGWHTVTPRIVVREAEQLVEVLKHVFGATGEYRPDMPAVMRIGDSTVMISDAGIREPSPAFLYVYVDNTDETYRRALEAGARSLEEPIGRQSSMRIPHSSNGMLLVILVSRLLEIYSHSSMEHQPSFESFLPNYMGT